MRGRARWGFGCLVLMLPGSAWAGKPVQLPHAAAAPVRFTLVAQYGSGGSAYPSASSASGAHGMFSGGYYHHGHQGLSNSTVGYAPYLAYGSNYYGFYLPPPLFVPADMLFGPDPLMQGIGNLNGGGPGVGGGPGPGGVGGAGGNVPPAGAMGQAVRAGPVGALGPGQPQRGAGAADNMNPPAPRKVRVTNAAAKARAGKFLQSGDTQFGKQKFYPALERYREGALAAPDLAECFFRQGFAQVALGQYEAAAKAFQRGLRLRPEWADSDFELGPLYGANHLAKLSHREGLAQAIEQNPLDAGLLLTMGAMLYFDGQKERSRLFFQRSAQLGGNDSHLLDGFLAPEPADADDKPADQEAGAKPAGKLNL